MKTEKISLTKDEGARALMAQAAGAEASHVVFVIPRSSALAGDEEAFKKLKKVMEVVGKTVSIESVDDGVLAAAKAAGLEAQNPFFGGAAPSWEDTPAHFADGPDDEPAPVPVATPVVARSRPAPKPIYRRRIEEDDEDFKPRRRMNISRRSWVVAVIVVAVLVPSYWVAFYALPTASVTIVTEKKEWKYSNLFAIEKNGPVPSSIVIDTKNAQMTFLATGKKVVNQKATGMITVYNGYSSDPQQLVATTRFEAPDGKIFRLTKSVTIPGAKIESGIITPSSIEAEVVADKPGPAYNITAPKLTIPGFKGTPKFAGFYGEAKKALAGGFVGEAAYPTDADITAAKAKITVVLEQSLTTQITAKAGGDYVVAKGATQLTLTKVEVNPQVNGKGEFSLFAEAELKALVFKESDMLGNFSAKMKKDLGNDAYVFKTKKLSYDTPSKVDFKAQRMDLPVNFEGVAELPIDVAAVRSAVAGKTRGELNLIIGRFAGAKQGTVSFSPFYVRTIPSSATAEKIRISLE